MCIIAERLTELKHQDLHTCIRYMAAGAAVKGEGKTIREFFKGVPPLAAYLSGSGCYLEAVL